MTDNTNELADALVRIHAKLKNPSFDSTNPHFRNKYVSLAGARDAIADIAASEGVVVIQDLVTDEHGVGCKTILLHKSGQRHECGPLFLPAAKQDPQGFGSCATYARRYSLLAAFNLVGDDDDDANAGQDAHARHQSAPRPAPTRTTNRATPAGARSEAAPPPDSELVAQAKGLMRDATTIERLNEVFDRVMKSEKFTDADKRNLTADFKQRADRLEDQLAAFGGPPRDPAEAPEAA